MSGQKEKLILGIETSCDETAAAVVSGRRILSNVISSQIDIHRLYGGVVPEVASRNHTLAVSNVVKEALNGAGVKFSDIDAIAATYGSGLLGALLVGVSYAKAAAYALSIPLIPVNHIAGHIAANYIAHEELEPPFICLLASGGHTAVIKVQDYTDFQLLGTTRDDAAGEAFDKVARMLKLKYPGGPEIEKLAKEGQANIILPKPYKGEDHLDFSYSGIKTAVLNYININEMKGQSVNKADVAASFQEAAVNMLVHNSIEGAKRTGLSKIAIAGGVGANGALRAAMDREAAKHGIKVYYPPLSLCTDNAAMIACHGYYMLSKGARPAKLDLDAEASIKLSDLR
jgi:N6-L-threonylcarbamoyladenine synthase